MRPWLYVFLSAGMAACGNSSTPTGIDSGMVSTDVPVSTGTDVPAPTDTGPAGLPGSYYCAAPASPPTCRVHQTGTCGVCVPVPAPVAIVTRTACDETTLGQSCDPSNTPGPANLSCFNPATPPVAGTPQMVTLWGSVHPFGNGMDSGSIQVTVYLVDSNRNPVQPPVGTAISDTSAPGNVIETVYMPDRTTVSFMRNLGGYQIPNVPTETELLVETVGAPGTEAANLWSHPIYDYNVMLHNSQVVTLPAAPGSGDAGVGTVPTPPSGIMGATAVYFQPSVLATTDWNAIPSAATLITGIPVGHGAIAGEVHDCDDVRLNNATVASNPLSNFSLGTVYFSDNDTNPLPDTSRMAQGTSILGTYALLDVSPGLVTVAATGWVSTTELAHLGSYVVQVFPNAVTAVDFRGLRPWQVPH